MAGCWRSHGEQLVLPGCLQLIAHGGRTRPFQLRLGGADVCRLQSLLCLQVGDRGVGRRDAGLRLLYLGAERCVVDPGQNVAGVHGLEVIHQHRADASPDLGRKWGEIGRRRGIVRPLWSLMSDPAVPVDNDGGCKTPREQKRERPGRVHQKTANAGPRRRSVGPLARRIHPFAHAAPSDGSRCGRPISCCKAGLVNPSARPRRDSTPRGARNWWQQPGGPGNLPLLAEWTICYGPFVGRATCQQTTSKPPSM